VGGQNALLAIISDGAGTAKFSSVGSRLAVECFARCAISHLRTSPLINGITEELVREWLDTARDHIFRSADQLATIPRELAATLVAAVVCSDGAIVCHIGDGACVLRKKGKRDLEVASWPAHGEYANSTYFITDEPEPNLQFTSLDGEFSDLAIFSDGLERLALDFSTKSAFDRFFQPIFGPLATLPPGRNRGLSAILRNYLDSQRIIERTEDDKSLILARRVIYS
jgi:hypothetical protein